jgi:hypothetical protein
MKQVASQSTYQHTVSRRKCRMIVAWSRARMARRDCCNSASSPREVHALCTVSKYSCIPTHSLELPNETSRRSRSPSTRAEPDVGTAENCSDGSVFVDANEASCLPAQNKKMQSETQVKSSQSMSFRLGRLSTTHFVAMDRLSNDRCECALGVKITCNSSF